MLGRSMFRPIEIDLIHAYCICMHPWTRKEEEEEETKKKKKKKKKKTGPHD
jgi:hypothetical protein